MPVYADTLALACNGSLGLPCADTVELPCNTTLGLPCGFKISI